MPRNDDTRDELPPTEELPIIVIDEPAPPAAPPVAAGTVRVIMRSNQWGLRRGDIADLEDNDETRKQIAAGYVSLFES